MKMSRLPTSVLIVFITSSLTSRPVPFAVTFLKGISRSSEPSSNGISFETELSFLNRSLLNLDATCYNKSVYRINPKPTSNTFSSSASAGLKFSKKAFSSSIWQVRVSCAIVVNSSKLILAASAKSGI